WNEALNACANVGKATLAMLVPSEASNIDSERLASASRTDAVRPGLCSTASSRPATIAFNVNSIVWRPRKSGTDRHVVPGLTWRNPQHLHFIRAFDATSPPNCA